MFLMNSQKWTKIMVAGLVSTSLLGGSALLAQAHETTNPAVKPAATSVTNSAQTVTKPVANPLLTQAASQLMPTEPAADEGCGFCKMDVYEKSEGMGEFASQLITEDGKRVFFDDLGCMMNYKHTLSKPAKLIWVRDYYTKEWFLASKATLVSSEVKTPMKYGYSVFKDQASAAKFIKENQAKHAVKATWQQLDAVAQKRAQAKMNMNMNMSKPMDHMQQPAQPTTPAQPTMQMHH